MTLVPRLLASVMIAAGGFIHLELWSDGYRGIPRVGTLFVVNAVASVLLAVGLLVTGDRRLTLAAAVLSLSSLVALVLSRTSGFFGFVEPTWTPEALQAVAAELGALVALALVAARRRVGARVAGEGAAVPA